MALADLSNRGALDVIVANQNQPALLYRNDADSANHWIAFSLVGTRSNRSAIGAEVVVESGGTKQRRVVDGGMGFASQNDRRLHFGLGRSEWVDRVVIRWPSGTAGAHAPRGGSSSTRSPSRTDDARPKPRRAARTRPARATCGRATSRVDPRYLIAFLITLVLRGRAAPLPHGGRLRRGSRSRCVTCVADRGAALVVRARQGREPAERLHQRSSASRCSSSRRAGALWPFVLGGFLAIASKYVLQYRGQPSLEPDQLRDRGAAARRAGSRLGAEPPVGQRPRDEPGDLDLRPRDRRARARPSHHADVRRQRSSC